MELPSIKLNIFKKLDYFLILKALNTQFKIQFKLLKKKGWDEKEKKFKGTYPSWEIEKKILFWSYINHKHLGRPIHENHFSNMFICSEEYRHIEIKKIFENLEKRGFGRIDDRRDGLYLSEKGLAFGELLWYLYVIKKYEREDNCEPREYKQYQDIYQNSYRLSELSLGYCILQSQVFAVFSLTVYAIALFTFEILNFLGLLDNLRMWFMGKLYHPNILLLLIVLPFLVFVSSLVCNCVYRFLWVDKKYLKIEKMRENFIN